MIVAWNDVLHGPDVASSLVTFDDASREDGQATIHVTERLEEVGVVTRCLASTMAGLSIGAAIPPGREIQDRTGLSLRRVLRTLKPLRSATIAINGITTTFPPELSPDEKTLLDALQRPRARH